MTEPLDGAIEDARSPIERDQAGWVLLLTRNFPPLLGGMEKLNQRMLASLQQQWRTALCGPTGCRTHVGVGVEVRESAVTPLPVFLLATLGRAVSLARRLRPTWVLAGSGLTAPLAWLVARCCGARFGIYLHGLDIVAPSRVYQYCWLPFVRRCDLALVNSRNTLRLAELRGVRSRKLHVLHPGTDVPELDPAAALQFRQSLKLGERPLLLSVGRLTQRKGLVPFVLNALPAIVACRPDALLLVIGSEASDALHVRAGAESERILTAARQAGVDTNVRFVGYCDDATLGAAYQAADLHIFPVLDLPGDVEGFGMVALEAAAHGLPTVAFAVGGVPDAVQAEVTGSLVKPGDYRGFATQVEKLLGRPDREGSAAACREFAAGKSWDAFARRLLHLLGAADD